MSLKKRCLYFLLSFLFFCQMNLFAQGTPGITMGGIKNDVGLSICPAHNDGYAIAGSTRSFGAGSNDFYFLIINNNGKVIQKHTYGWEHQDFFRDVIKTNNGYAFVGDAWDFGKGRLDIIMMQTDLSGNITQKAFYGTLMRDNGFCILPAKDEGFLILGHSRIETPGEINLYKIDNEANLMWQQSYLYEGNDYAFKIIRSSQDDGYVFVGSKNGFFDDVHADFRTHDADILLIKVDNDGNLLWKHTYGKSEHDFGYSVCNAPDGGYYLLGASQSYGSGSFDMLLLKTDEDGNEEWHKSFGGSDYEYGKSLAINSDGDLFLTGSTKSFGTDNSVDVFVVKTDAYGNEIWSETFGGSKNDFGEDVITTPEGGCVIVGSSNSFGKGGSDAYLLRLTTNGDLDLFENIHSKPVNLVVFYPNPMAVSGVFIMPDISQDDYILQLFDSFGRLSMQKEFHGNRIDIQKENRTAGTYFYKIISKTDPSVYYNGKLIIQ